MKYALIITLLVVILAAAPIAHACQHCKRASFDCFECVENGYNGAQNCVLLLNGEMCVTYNGSCEGPLGDDCVTDPSTCVLNQGWNLPERRPLQLADVVVLRPRAEAISRPTISTF